MIGEHCFENLDAPVIRVASPEMPIPFAENLEALYLPIRRIEDALNRLDPKYHGAIDKPEGLVYRLEREGKLLFRAKYVHLEKIDGCFLTENTGKPELWNWQPEHIH